MKIQLAHSLAALLLAGAFVGCGGKTARESADEAAKQADELRAQAGEKLDQAARDLEQGAKEAEHRADEWRSRTGEEIDTAGRDLRKGAGEVGEEAGKAGREAEKKVGQAGRDLEEKTDEAGHDLEGKHAHAGKDKGVSVQGGSGWAGSAPKEGAAAASGYEHFEAIDNETKDAFAARASTAITRLERDIASLERQAKADDDAFEDLSDAKKAVNEARTDLTEVKSGDEAVLADGKVGVSLAINKAQRELTNVRENLADD